MLAWLGRRSRDPGSFEQRDTKVFDRNGVVALFVAEFVPGLTTVTPPLAGMVPNRTGPVRPL
jgi:membrane protein DedA with SNARE-associated domain